MQKCFPEGDADAQKPSLQFPPAKETNLDGFKTGWVPGCFPGGTAFIRAYDGGTGGGQSRLLHGRDGSPQPSDFFARPAPVGAKKSVTPAVCPYRVCMVGTARRSRPTWKTWNARSRIKTLRQIF